MHHKPSHVVEYVLLRVVSGLFRLLPYRAALFVGWTVALPSFWLARKKRQRTMRRLRQVFGDRYTERELRGIAWRAWRNLVFSGIETMRVPGVTLDWAKKVTDHRDLEKLLTLTKNGSGVCLTIVHMGSWELSGVVLQLFGAQLMTIVRKQKNLLINDYLNRLRSLTGVDTTFREAKSFAPIVHKLKQGKVLAMPIDLHAKGPSLRVRFLGHETNIPAGMAHFARQANVPMLPAYITRQGWARHVWTGGDPIWADPSLDQDADILRMTQQALDFLTRAVFDHPDQYFWHNKRWVLGEEP